MIYIIFLSCLISFIELHAMLPNAEEQTINITCLDNEKTKMPVSIVVMSKTLYNMIGDLGGTITDENGTISIKLDDIDNINFPISSSSCSTIKNLCAMLKNFNTTQTLNKQNIEANTLKNMITISNAFHFLDFSENKNLAEQWNKKIYGSIYQHCKDMSWNELESQIIPLYPKTLHQDLTQIIFCTPIINKIKFELLKQSFTDYREIKLPTYTRIDTVFSPNNKMLATVISHLKNTSVSILLFENDTITNKQNTLNIKNYWHNGVKFSNDSKKFIVGSENNILIYAIDNDGNINTNPIQTLIVSAPIDRYPENKKISLSQDGKLMASYYVNDLRLWHFDENGMVNEKTSHILLTIDIDTEILISPIKFDDDGTICIISRNTTDKTSTLHILNPDDPNKNTQSKIDVNLLEVSFYEHDKKFAAMIYEDADSFTRKKSIYLYDFNDINNINTSRELISSARFDTDAKPCIIFDDTAILAKISHHQTGESYDELSLIDINNNANSIKIPIKDIGNFYISPDNKKMIFFDQSKLSYELYTLLTPPKENALKMIRTLDIKPILLLDRILRKTEDASSLANYDIPNEIIDLLRAIGLETQKKEVLPKEESHKKEAISIEESHSGKPTQSQITKQVAAIAVHQQQQTKTTITAGNPPQITPQTNVLPTKTEQSNNNKPEPGIFEWIGAGISSIASTIISTIGSFVSAILKLITG